MIKTFSLLFAGVVTFVAFYVGQSHRPLHLTDALRHSTTTPNKKPSPSPVSPHPKIKLRPTEQVMNLKAPFTLTPQNFRPENLAPGSSDPLVTSQGLIVSYDVRDLIYKIEDYRGPDLSFTSSDRGAEIIIEEDDTPVFSADDLLEIIHENVSTEKQWENFNAESRNGRLVVLQEAHVHYEISHLLDSFRRNPSYLELLKR